MEGNYIHSNSAKPPCALRRRKDRLLQNGNSGGESHGLGKKKTRDIIYALLYFMPPVAAVLCYVNGVDGDFVHDDVYAIKDNADAVGKTPLASVFADDFWGSAMCDNASHKSYRPLTVLTFRLDYYLGGGRPWQFHVVNVVLHALVTSMFSLVLRHALHVQDVVAVAAAMLFAVHPVHTEAVTGIVGRAELLSCVGVLLSILLYSRSVYHEEEAGQKAGSRKKSSQRSSSRTLQAAYFSLAMVGSGAAMLCKEQGIMGLGLCAVFDVFVFSRTATLRWLNTRKMDTAARALCTRLAAVLCVGAGLMGFRVWMMCGQKPFFTEEDNPASFSTSLLERILTFNYLVAFNAWLLLCPRVLNYDWQVGSIPLVTGLADVRNLATVVFYLFLTSAGLRCLREFLKQDEPKDDVKNDDNDKNNNTNTPTTTTTTTATTSNSNVTGSCRTTDSNTGHGHVLLVSLALMALPFLPSSNLFFRVGFVVAERVLYVPSTGFCLLVAHGAVTLWQRCCRPSQRHLRGCLILSATALFLLLAAKTYERNQVWKTRESLFRSGIRILPHNAKMHYNYANFLRDSGDSRQAEHHYKTAIRLYDKQPSYHNNLGSVVTDSREAEQCYRAALRLNPVHRGALVNLGNVLHKRNDSSGEELLRQALSLYPDYIEALRSLAQLSMGRGQWEEAGLFVRRALKQRPDLPDLHHYLGIVLHQTGRYEAAVVSYRRAVSLDSTFTHAMTNAAFSLRYLGREHEAEHFLKRAVAVVEDRQTLEQLGQLYHRTGRTQDAVDVYTQMVTKAPNDTQLLLDFVKTLMNNGQPRQAKEVLTGILSRSPHSPEAFYAMGHVQELLGQLHEALAAFQEASRWVENDTQLLGKILHDQGNVYKDLRMYPQALQSYEASLEADPMFTAARHNLAVLHHIMGHYEQALQHYELVLKEEPTNQLLLENMAKLSRVSREQSVQKPPPP